MKTEERQNKTDFNDNDDDDDNSNNNQTEKQNAEGKNSTCLYF